jgi:hypothetical protein
VLASLAEKSVLATLAEESSLTGAIHARFARSLARLTWTAFAPTPNPANVFLTSFGKTPPTPSPLIIPSTGGDPLNLCAIISCKKNKIAAVYDFVFKGDIERDVRYRARRRWRSGVRVNVGLVVMEEDMVVVW